MPTRDCPHRLDSGACIYPGDPPISVEPHATVDADGHRVSALALGTHAGTHLDAPSHTEARGATVDELSVETFTFDAVLVCLGGDVGAREPIGLDRLPEEVDDADLLVLDAGWGAHWGTDPYLHHPHLDEAAAV